MKRPHIVYILSDQHRGQAMGHMGDPNVLTPQMDRLASEGVSFSRAYSNCPICTPSRGSIFSGRHAHSGPVGAFFDNYKIAAPSTATLLRDQGYHTAYFGKWHCGIIRNQIPDNIKEIGGSDKSGWARTPERHRAGFQDWFGYECINRHNGSFYYHNDDTQATFLEKYETDGMTDLAIDYIQSYDKEEPLFLVLSVNPPHFPFLVPEEFRRHDPEGLSVPPNFSEKPELREKMAIWYGMVENLDWNIGRLMDAVQNIPGFEDTLTVYFSDHGEFIGSHGYVTGKAQPYEEAVRIPSIFHWPGKIKEKGLSDGFFSIIDMLPTTLGLIGAPVPDWIQGTDFSPLLRGNEFKGPDSVLTEIVGNPHWSMESKDWRGIITDSWKYAFYEDGSEMLFNTAEDPYEMNNLASTQPGKREEMKQLLLDELVKAREPFFDVIIRNPVPPDLEDIDITKLPASEK